MPTRVFVSEDRSKILVLFSEAACVFANFYPSGFTAKPLESFVKDPEPEKKKDVKTLNFNSSQQYFSYHKALLVGDHRTAQQILQERNPFIIQLIGKKLKMSKEKLNEWTQQSRDVMYRACLEKFASNEKCRKQLFRTHGMKLVKASHDDGLWGIGLDKNDRRIEDERTWKGTNWLGKILDKVREELWIRTEFKEEREQIEKESLETRIHYLQTI
ncbi:unnamed protein product [Caenorhabditis brenneri]